MIPDDKAQNLQNCDCRPTGRMSTAYKPELEPIRGPYKGAAANGDGQEAPIETQYKYEGKDDDRPLIWREPMNELQGAINELLTKRKKKLGASLSKAENMTPINDDDEINLNRPRSSRLSGRIPKRQSQKIDRSIRPDSARSGGSGGPSPRSSGQRPQSGRPLSASGRNSRELPAYSTNADQLGEDWEEVDEEELLDFDADERGPAEEDPRLRAARKEQFEKAKAEYLAKQRELEQVRAVLASEDVLLKVRQSHSNELQTSIAESEEGAEQAHTWIKSLEDVHRKRKSKLQEHEAKISKAEKTLEECEAALEELQVERTAAVSEYTRKQALHANTAKVENKTSDIWRQLEEEVRALHKETEEQAAEKQREQMRISKFLQDLEIGEQELRKRHKTLAKAAAEIFDEGKDLHKFWRREYLEEEMVLGAAVAEMEAEERARSHLAGHGRRIRDKLEAASGNLNAQRAMIEDQTQMDQDLKAKTDSVEAQIREVQTLLDESEGRRAGLDREREDIQQQCQDKVEHLNSSLRAIETSANAVATEQVIAQRTLASSEEALETLEAGEARARLEEDIEALRTSLVSIEARLHEVQKERSAVRETRARTQRAALEEAGKVTDKMDAEDVKCQELLARRVELEAEQRQLDGQRVVIHARVKQSKKSITPLEQEKKLYEAELEWVKEFEEHSYMRMEEKREAKQVLEQELGDLKAKGSRQLQEQADDEGIVQQGMLAFQELQHKIKTHKEYVEWRLKTVQEALAQHEQDSLSLAATVEVHLPPPSLPPSLLGCLSLASLMLCLYISRCISHASICRRCSLPPLPSPFAVVWCGCVGNLLACAQPEDQ